VDGGPVNVGLGGRAPLTVSPSARGVDYLGLNRPTGSHLKNVMNVMKLMNRAARRFWHTETSTKTESSMGCQVI